MRIANNVVIAVDILIENKGKIVLIKRKYHPHVGKLALPGGMVEREESVEDAAVREAREETSLNVKLKEILGVYSSNKLDPRGYAITTVFLADIVGGKLRASDDAQDIGWFDIKKINLKKLGFKHHVKILKDYMKWKKRKGTYWLKR